MSEEGGIPEKGRKRVGNNTYHISAGGFRRLFIPLWRGVNMAGFYSLYLSSRSLNTIPFPCRYTRN